MSSEDIEEQIQEIYEVDLDQTTVSKITNTMLENIKEWKSRLLKQEYYIANQVRNPKKKQKIDFQAYIS